MRDPECGTVVAGFRLWEGGEELPAISFPLGLGGGAVSEMPDQLPINAKRTKKLKHAANTPTMRPGRLDRFEGGGGLSADVWGCGGPVVELGSSKGLDVGSGPEDQTRSPCNLASAAIPARNRVRLAFFDK